MHVVLVGAEFEENLAVRYLRGALEHEGHPVTSLVFNEASEIERVAREIVAAGAPLTGLSIHPVLQPEAEKELVRAASRLTFDQSARGQRFVVQFSDHELTGASADATAPPPKDPTHMKERVPRPEMAPRPPPPRPEMAPRPPPKPDKSGPL